MAGPGTGGKPRSAAPGKPAPPSAGRTSPSGVGKPWRSTRGKPGLVHSADPGSAAVGQADDDPADDAGSRSLGEDPRPQAAPGRDEPSAGGVWDGGVWDGGVWEGGV
ncbi:MAG TPA: hypothetical protein VGM79_24575 [Streptosporangiaceae bacterium]